MQSSDSQVMTDDQLMALPQERIGKSQWYRILDKNGATIAIRSVSGNGKTNIHRSTGFFRERPKEDNRPDDQMVYTYKWLKPNLSLGQSSYNYIDDLGTVISCERPRARETLTRGHIKPEARLFLSHPNPDLAARGVLKRTSTSTEAAPHPSLRTKDNRQVYYPVYTRSRKTGNEIELNTDINAWANRRGRGRFCGPYVMTAAPTGGFVAEEVNPKTLEVINPQPLPNVQGASVGEPSVQQMG